MPGDSDIEELPDIDDDLAEYGDIDAVLRQGNSFSLSHYCRYLREILYKCLFAQLHLHF
jgi:hypothetical protein